MNNKAMETKLLDLEQQYWQAMKDKDIEAAVRMTDDPCIVAGASGVMKVDRQTFIKMMETAKWTIKDVDLSDAQVRMLGDDVAIVAYKVRENLTVDGKPVTLEAADSSTWLRRDGQWKCALHTESLAGDPYGRN